MDVAGQSSSQLAGVGAPLTAGGNVFEMLKPALPITCLAAELGRTKRLLRLDRIAVRQRLEATGHGVLVVRVKTVSAEVL